MIHEEKTTEIELPWAKKAESISAPLISNAQAPALQAHEEAKEVALKQWIRDLDMNSPWVIRLLGVIAILLLSLLVV